MNKQMNGKDNVQFWKVRSKSNNKKLNHFSYNQEVEN